MAILLEQLIERVSPDVESRVRQTRDKARPFLQEALRSECRLVMRTAQESEENRAGAQVPIEVVPGYPAILKAVQFPDEFQHILLLTRHRASLEQAGEGVSGLIQLRKELLRLPDSEKWVKATESELTATLRWATELLDLIERYDPVSRVLAVHDDILGIYEYQATNSDDKAVNRATIRLYWGVIGLVSDWMGLSVEDLTIVVLAHELAHAYTQLGADIEGRRWPSRQFSRAEKALKEGLAQYYTDRVLTRLDRRYGGAFKAYEALLAKQPEEYRTHIPWIEHCSPEAVRRAMIEVRRWDEGTIAQFEGRLASAAEQLRPSVSDLFS
jgi:hypothetical protein